MYNGICTGIVCSLFHKIILQFSIYQNSNIQKQSYDQNCGYVHTYMVVIHISWTKHLVMSKLKFKSTAENNGLHVTAHFQPTLVYD